MKNRIYALGLAGLLSLSSNCGINERVLTQNVTEKVQSYELDRVHKLELANEEVELKLSEFEDLSPGEKLNVLRSNIKGERVEGKNGCQDYVERINLDGKTGILVAKNILGKPSCYDPYFGRDTITKKELDLSQIRSSLMLDPIDSLAIEYVVIGGLNDPNFKKNERKYTFFFDSIRKPEDFNVRITEGGNYITNDSLLDLNELVDIAGYSLIRKRIVEKYKLTE